MSVVFSVPWGRKVVTKEMRKSPTPLAMEIRKMHPVLMKIVPLVLGTLVVVSGPLDCFFYLGILDVLGGIQASTATGTTLILQKTLCL